MSERLNSNNEEHILCKDIKSLSTFKDKIIFRKHTKRINHIMLISIYKILYINRKFSKRNINSIYNFLLIQMI